MARIARVCVGVSVASLTLAAVAGPSLPVTKPPVQPLPSWTGPGFDPHATNGQWFAHPTGLLEPRSHEFYDNALGFGGGFLGTDAIYGKVTNVVTAPGSAAITGFEITATITNDGPSTTLWQPGRNSHQEFLNTQEQYAGTLYKAKLTAEFALASLQLVPAAWVGPYRDRPEYIVALNNDQLAWYCYSPDNPVGLGPAGDFYVPAWEFGDIPVGGSVTRILQFGVAGAITPNDTRYGAIMGSFQAPAGQGDIFLNRSTDLKIGDWLDEIARDPGFGYPTDWPLRGGNVSVFHNIPEPASLALLAIGALLRRRAA